MTKIMMIIIITIDLLVARLAGPEQEPLQPLAHSLAAAGCCGGREFESQGFYALPHPFCGGCGSFAETAIFLV